MTDSLSLQEAPIFESQIEWLKVLIKFMKKRDDLFMII